MADQISMEEIRTFCISNLELLNKLYEVINPANEADYNKFINRRMTLADEFFTKVRYAISFAFKIVMVVVRLGHYVDFETYKDYKENRGIVTGNDIWTEHIRYIYETGLKMPVVIQNTINLIKTDDDALMRYYGEIIKHLRSQNIVQPHIRAILACGAKIPFEPSHFDRMFEIHENTTSADVLNTNYVTQIKTSFAAYQKRLNETQSAVMTKE